MPTFTSSNTIPLNKVHLTVIYDSKNSVCMYVDTNDKEEFVSDVDYASDIHMSVSGYEIGEGLDGILSNFVLTYGIESDEMISTYSYKADSIFGYNFDQYKDNTNNEFDDNGGNGANDLVVVGSQNGIQFSSDSYMPFVASLQFNDGTAYLESQGSNLDLLHIDNYDITNNKCGIVFWINTSSTGGPVIHLDGVFDISYSSNKIIYMNSSGEQYSSSNLTSYYHNNSISVYNNEWAFVCIDVSNNSLYVNGLSVSWSSSSSSGSFTTVSSASLFIGGYPTPTPTSKFEGKLDAIYGFKNINTDSVSQIYEQFQNEHAYTVPHVVLTDTAIKNDWTHIAASYNKSTHDLSIYHNGNLFTKYRNYIPNIDPNQIVDNSNNSMLIAKEGENYFDGGIDDIRVYRNTLTGGDVKEVYNQYYQTLNEGENKLIFQPSTTNITISGINMDESNVTFNVSGISDGTIKYLAIADHNLDSRQIIDKIIGNSDFDQDIKTTTTLQSVIVIDENNPGLTFRSVDLNKVNDFDIFVYDFKNRAVGRENLNAGSNVGPYIHIETSTSDGQLVASAFSAYANLSKYYVYMSDQDEATENQLVNIGSLYFINGVRNSVVNITQALSTPTSGYIHVMLEDANGDRSSVVSYNF